MGGTELNLMENSSSPIKEEEEEPAKKNATQSLQALYYIFIVRIEKFLSRFAVKKVVL